MGEVGVGGGGGGGVDTDVPRALIFFRAILSLVRAVREPDVRWVFSLFFSSGHVCSQSCAEWDIFHFIESLCFASF